MMESVMSQLLPWLLGGSLLATWQWWYTRKVSRRQAAAEAAAAEAQAQQAGTEATASEFHLTQELLAEIKDKTGHIRKLNETLLERERRIHELEMTLYDTECKRRPCAFRHPTKPFTPCYPTAETNVFDYFNVRRGGDEADTPCPAESVTTDQTTKRDEDID